MLKSGHTILESGRTVLHSCHTVLHSGHVMLQSGHTMLQCGHTVLQSGHTVSGTHPALIQSVLGVLSAKIKGSERDADPSRPLTYRLSECVELYLSFRIFLDGMQETTCHRSKISHSDPIGNLMHRLWQGSANVHLWHKSGNMNVGHRPTDRQLRHRPADMHIGHGSTDMHLGHRPADRQLRHRPTDIHIGQGSADMHVVHRLADRQLWHRYLDMHLRHRSADIHLCHVYYYISNGNLKVKTWQFLSQIKAFTGRTSIGYIWMLSHRFLWIIFALFWNVTPNILV